MKLNLLTTTLSAVALAAVASLGVTIKAQAITLGRVVNSAVFGDEMEGMVITTKFANGSTESATWTATDSGAGQASGTDWTLSQSGDTFGNPWNFSYSGSSSVTSLKIDAIPGLIVFDTIDTLTSPPSTSGSFRGLPFTPQSGVAPANSFFADPPDFSQGDLFENLTLSWNPGDFGGGSNLTYIADTDRVPEPLTILGSVTVLGVGALLKKEYLRRLKKATSQA